MQQEPRWSNAKEAPAPRRREPWLSQSEGGPLTHAAGAFVVPKWEKPARPCGAGLGGPHAGEAPSPMQRGPRRSQSEVGPCGGGLGGPQVGKARSSMRRGPPWSPC